MPWRSLAQLVTQVRETAWSSQATADTTSPSSSREPGIHGGGDVWEKRERERLLDSSRHTTRWSRCCHGSRRVMPCCWLTSCKKLQSGAAKSVSMRTRALVTGHGGRGGGREDADQRIPGPRGHPARSEALLKLEVLRGGHLRAAWPQSTHVSILCLSPARLVGEGEARVP